jgi:hypothetical protein
LTREPIHVFLGAMAQTKGTSPRHSVLRDALGGTVPLHLKIRVLHPNTVQVLFCLSLFACATLAFSQAAQPDSSPMPKYDLLTEIKTKGVVDEINLLSLGTRKDFTELVLKNGDDKVRIYLCPKAFQDEMGITFAKGDQIAVTGSRVKQDVKQDSKQDAADVILVRELVKGTDTLMFRDAKGAPVWNPRTGK